MHPKKATWKFINKYGLRQMIETYLIAFEDIRSNEYDLSTRDKGIQMLRDKIKEFCILQELKTDEDSTCTSVPPLVSWFTMAVVNSFSLVVIDKYKIELENKPYSISAWGLISGRDFLPEEIAKIFSEKDKGL